jgi:single-stranded DNA-specific DHH superfamily exonuclease
MKVSLGLVAAKLVQKYYRPSIVISFADGQGKGSVTIHTWYRFYLDLAQF